MEGRTYRFMTETPMYPFGFGLSYATFDYSDIQLSSDAVKKDQSVQLSCTVENKSDQDSDEVVQLYIRLENEKISGPLYSLKGVHRIHLKAGEKRRVEFEVTPDMLKLVDEKGVRTYGKGTARFYVAGSLPSERSQELGASPHQTVTLRMK